MKTQLIAFTTATAIALTGLSAAPAQASPEDNLVKFLVGAVIIGAIVNEVNRNNTATVKPHTHYKRTNPTPRRHTAFVTRGKPAACKRSAYGKHGLKVWFRKSCMAKRGWEKHGNGVWHTHR
ncbi:MAG: hypothetical protein GXP03_10450 [Alphaproteobacteria bacterium]|nr:hypothetical protein [Alphaproteobacteria bacterium]